MRYTPPSTQTPMPWRFSERRAYPRQRRLIRVLVIPQDHVVDEPYGAWLLDSAPGGLRLALNCPTIAEGAVLKVRSQTARPGGTWTTVQVMSCRHHHNQIELGCQIVRRTELPRQ